MHIFAALFLPLLLSLPEGLGFNQGSHRQLQTLRSSQQFDVTQSILSGRRSGRTIPDSDGLVDIHEYLKSERYKSAEHAQPRCILEGRSPFPYFSVNITICESHGKCCACHNPWMSKAPCCGKNMCNRYGIFDPATKSTTSRPSILTTTSAYIPEIPPQPQGPSFDPNINYLRCTCKVPGGYYGECAGVLCKKPCCACALNLGSGLPCCGASTCSTYGFSQSQDPYWGYP